MILSLPCWTHDPVTVATVVIAAATVVNLLVSAGLWYATARTATIAEHAFEAANRPYVGVESIIALVDRTKKELNVTAIIKNFGSVPAEESTIRWEILMNGVAQPQTAVPDKPLTLFPTEISRLHAFCPDPFFGQIMAGTATLEIIVRAVYYGPGKKSYIYHEKSQYEPVRNVFSNLGRVE